MPAEQEPRATGIGARLTRLWVRLYTAGAPATARDRRRLEIESELWERQQEIRSRGTGPIRASVEMLAALVRGMGDDLALRKRARQGQRTRRPSGPAGASDRREGLRLDQRAGASGSGADAPRKARQRQAPVSPESRNPGRGNPLDELLHDVRFGLRALRRTPVFTAVAVSCLALGIGVNTAIFSVVDGVLLSSLPFAEPERLVAVREVSVESGRPARGNSGALVSYPDFVDLQAARLDAFDDLALLGASNYLLLGGDEPEHLRGAPVTSNWFEMLGVPAALGRAFRPGERGAVVVLSDQLWRRRFGADPDVVGRTVRVEDELLEVVGVMPPGFRLLYSIDQEELWVPLESAPSVYPVSRMDEREIPGFRLIGRLAPGATLDRARSELDVIAARLRDEYPEASGEMAMQVISLHAFQVRGIRPTLLLLMGAVGLVLLIACVNVANLLLARAARRRREVAVRSALGAGRWRIVRQLLTESTLLALAGGAIGLLLAGWSAAAIRATAGGDIPRIQDIGVDLGVLAYAFLASLVAAWLFGIVPALRASRLEPGAALRGGGQGGGGAAPGTRLREGLVVLEVALAMVLLVGAGLMASSFRHLWAYEPGFDPDGVLTARLQLDRSRYTDWTQRDAFFQRLYERLRGLPGVTAVGGSGTLPDRIRGAMTMTAEGGAPTSSRELFSAFRTVSGDYFEVLRIPLLAGRFFRPGEGGVLMVNEAFARHFWPGEPAVGKRLVTVRQETLEVVGVVGSRRFTGRSRRPLPPDAETLTSPAEFLVPYGTAFGDGTGGLTRVFLRTAGEPEELAGALREIVGALDPRLPVEEIRTMDQFLADRLARPRFYTALFGLFGVLALALAAAGVFGVASYSVAQRTHELGVRIALGARSGDLLRLIVGRGALLAAIGIVLGLGGALGLARLLESFLYGVSPTDPATLAAVTALLGAVALLAFYLPARRAARVDPLATLRQD